MVAGWLVSKYRAADRAGVEDDQAADLVRAEALRGLPGDLDDVVVGVQVVAVGARPPRALSRDDVGDGEVVAERQAELEDPEDEQGEDRRDERRLDQGGAPAARRKRRDLVSASLHEPTGSPRTRAVQVVWSVGVLLLS